MKTTLRPLLVPALAAIALCACQPAARATPPDASPPESNTPEANAPEATPRPQAQPAPAPAPVEGPARAKLALGDTARIGNGRLRLLRVVNDSRCPEGAHCIWAGEVTLAFDFDDGSGKRAFELSQQRNPTGAVGGRNLTLKDYGPCQASKLPTAKECATVVLDDAQTR